MDLATLLKDEDLEVRRRAAWALSEMPAHCEPCESALLDALSDADETVQEFALLALQGLDASRPK